MSILLDKTKDISKLLDLNPLNIGKKIFDNIVWVIIITGIITILYIVYLMKQKFNISNKLYIIEKTYQDYAKNVNLDEKTIGGQTEKFDEIEPDKHTLTDVYIISSAGSYLVGWKILDFVSFDMILQTIKYGARYIEVDINLNQKKEIVIANGIKDGNWILNFNEISIDDFCKNLGEKMFNENYFINNKDPLLLYLNIQIPKNKMNLLYEYLYTNLKTHLLSPDYNVNGTINVLDVKLEELFKKLVIICNGRISGTKMENITNLKLGDRVKRINYDQLLALDERESINFNKNNLTIVEQNYSLKSINANPEVAFDKGCQIIAMNFQRTDDFMIQYLSRFYGKSFQVKPFELTKFVDKPMVGYDRNKIAFYYNENEYENIENDIEQRETKIDENCCYLILDGEMLQHFPNDRNKIFNSINKMTIKFKQLQGKLNQDYEDINTLNISNEKNLQSIINFMDKYYITTKNEKNETVKNEIDNILEEFENNNAPTESKNNTPSISTEYSFEDNFYFLKYYALYRYISRELRKLLEIERKKEFSKDGFQDICFGKDKNTCIASKICHYGENYDKENQCKPKTSELPFPSLCVPRHELNRDNCCEQDEYSNLGLRRLYHEIHTQKNFIGKWSSAKGIIEIPDEFNDRCEFKFITPHDKKEFTMFMVNSDGKYITMDNAPSLSSDINMTEYDYNEDIIRAKGTFIDPELRKLENIYKMPKLNYHGFCDMQMSSNDETGKPDGQTFEGYSKSELNSCQYKTKDDKKKNNDAFKGVYQYSNNVFNIDSKDKNINIYTEYLNKKYGFTFNNNLYVGSDAENDLEKQKCYKMISADCNMDLQKFFGRDIKTKFESVSPSISINKQFEKLDPDYIQEVFPPRETLIENFENKSNNSKVKKNDILYLKKGTETYCLGTDLNQGLIKEGEKYKPNNLYVNKCNIKNKEEIEHNHYFKLDKNKIIEKQTPINIPDNIEPKKCGEEPVENKVEKDEFSIGYDYKPGIFYLDKNKMINYNFENEFKINNLDKNKLKIEVKKPIKSHPSLCPSESELFKNKKYCLGLVPYCESRMKNSFEDIKFDDNNNIFFTLPNNENKSGNVGFVSCDTQNKDENQIWYKIEKEIVEETKELPKCAEKLPNKTCDPNPRVVLGPNGAVTVTTPCPS